jgi:predicted membrane channel-forming protein YqfA (hemolysin III family)
MNSLTEIIKIITLSLLLLVVIYLVARLITYAIAKSWHEVKNQSKQTEEKKNGKKES